MLRILHNNKIPFVILGICLSVLSGCTTLNPYTGQTEVSDATVGTGVGGLGGAAIGGLAGGGRGALIGGLIGAVAGGLVGHSMDEQNCELRQRLVGTGVQIREYGRYTQLVMASDVTFKTNQAEVRSSFYPTLCSVATVLRRYCRTNVVITGYTDNVGGEAYNQELSERRAASVGSFLTTQGVSACRIFTQGRGMRDPIASNETAEGRAMNRRVVITLRPGN